MVSHTHRSIDVPLNFCLVSTVQAAREILCIEAFSIIICQLSCQHSLKNDPTTLLRDALNGVSPSTHGKFASIFKGSNNLVITLQQSLRMSKPWERSASPLPFLHLRTAPSTQSVIPPICCPRPVPRHFQVCYQVQFKKSLGRLSNIIIICIFAHQLLWPGKGRTTALARGTTQAKIHSKATTQTGITAED